MNAKTALSVATLVAMIMPTACSSSSPSADRGEGGAGGAGTTSGASSTSSGVGSSGWTLMPLLDDTSTGQKVVHAGQDRITSIHYASLTQGLVATAGDEDTFDEGGMLYRTSQLKVESVAYSGAAIGPNQIQANFLDINPTKTGYAIGLSTTQHIVLSSDGGKTFTDMSPGNDGDFGLDHMINIVEGIDGAWTMVRDVGVIDTSIAGPAPTTQWTDIWAPEGIPPTPNPIPAGDCHVAPTPLGVPADSQYVYVSPDRQLVAYGAHDTIPLTVCVSHDGGNTFLAKPLANPLKEATGPTGVTFLNATTGFAWSGSDYFTNATYIERTTDGGETWAATTLPEKIVGSPASINAVFFAPDAVHGFAVGYFGENLKTLLLATTDGGVTWVESPSEGALQLAMQGLSATKLYAGFALDAEHIWVGGEHGALAANASGGN